MPIKWRDKIILFKLETTYGVDSTPTGATDALLVTNVVFTPMDGNDVSRELELAYLGAQGTVATELSAKITFNIELVPSGVAGTPPNWGPILRACSVAETVVAATSVTYNPITDNQESGSLYLWVGGTRFVMKGSRGNCTLEWTAQAIPYLRFEMMGIFALPTEAARSAPDLSGFKRPVVVSDTNTPTFQIGSTPLVMRKCMLNLGNAVETRFLVGSEGILITDKSETLEMTVEAVPLTTFDPYAAALAEATLALVLVHGVGAGRVTTLNVPTLQMQRPQGLENAQNIVEWPLRAVPLPTSGNDQWTLVLT